MALSGSLVDFPLEGVLRLLESTRKTGVLEIGAEDEVGVLEVTEGALTGARVGDDVGDAALGVIFSMAGGNFHFRLGTPGSRNLSGSLDAILERAGAERERMQAIRRAIPSDRMRFALSERALSGGPITIAPEHWRVLLNVDGKRDVNTLASAAGQGRLAALRHLHELIEAGLVDALEPAPEPPAPPSPLLAEQPPAPSAWQTAAPEATRWEAPPAVRPAPRAFEPAPPPAFEAPPLPQDFWPAPPPPAPAPADVAPSPTQPATEDLSALLQARLSALEEDAPAEPMPVPPTPQDFWQMQTPTPPPSAEPDDRLASLFGRATTLEPTPTPPPSPAVAGPPAPVAEPAPASSSPAAPVSHWLPPDTTAPILELEAPAPAKEEKHRGLFGFGRKRSEAAPAASAPAAAGTSSPGLLASFANALITEYNSGQYGNARLDERMNVRLRIVDEQADPLDRMLPVQDDRLDVAAVDRDFTQQASPYLAILVRQIFEDAERVFGKDKAKKGYRAAIKNGLGGDESVLRDHSIALMLPKV